MEIVELRIAAQNGDLARLHAALAEGVDVDFRDADGETALHCAAYFGHTACLKALLAAGASVDHVESEGGIPLHCASYAGCAACVRILIAAGSDVHREDQCGWTPFSWCFSCALYDGHCRVLKILLRAGADVRTETVPRFDHNTSAWALVDAIRAAGGWPQYVTLNPPTTFASVVNKAIHGALPEPLPLEIAAFLVPAGGF